MTYFVCSERRNHERTYILIAQSKICVPPQRAIINIYAHTLPNRGMPTFAWGDSAFSNVPLFFYWCSAWAGPPSVVRKPTPDVLVTPMKCILSVHAATATLTIPLDVFRLKIPLLLDVHGIAPFMKWNSCTHHIVP
jgi:hypothetical protein